MYPDRCVTYEPGLYHCPFNNCVNAPHPRSRRVRTAARPPAGARYAAR
jgi:hypothetical protein